MFDKVNFENGGGFVSFDGTAVNLKGGVYQINLNMEIFNTDWRGDYTVSLIDLATDETLITKKYIPLIIGSERISNYYEPFSLPFTCIVPETRVIQINVVNNSGGNITITGNPILSNIAFTRISNL
jgi:hypothetical protein